MQVTSLFPTIFLNYLREHTLSGIKAGASRSTFLDIWMVEVNGRVFARSWGKSSRSWFTAFIDEGTGQIRFTDQVIDVRGQLVTDFDLNCQIDSAYLTKYVQDENRAYAEAISKPDYHMFTMEFIPV